MLTTPASPAPYVLVIDDDPRTALLLKGTAPLSEQKFEVGAAPDGVRALRLLQHRKPDLVALSADLPGGLKWPEVVAGLRKAGCGAPVILVTRLAGVDQAEALARGVRDVLRKPLTAPALRGALASALADVRYRRQGAPLAQQLPAAAPAGREFDVLYAVGKSVASLTDLEEILHRVVEAAVYLAGAEQGSLMLIDRTTGELVIRAAKNYDETIARTLRLRTSDSLAGQVVQTGKPLRLSGRERTKLVTGLLVRAMLYVPLTVGGKAIGVLSVENRTAARDFTARDERVLSAMADYAAIAIDHARLYAELRARAVALETANRMLSEADRLKDEMIQNLSHELRTPLVYVKGYIDLVLESDFGRLSDEIAQGLTTVQRRINDLVKIIENVTALSQPEELKLQAEVVDLCALAASTADAFADAARQAAVTLVADLPAEPLSVRADPELIGLVLRNLIDNAIKFSPGGGLVTIGARPAEQDMVEVIVSDSGVGIPADKLGRIFERFYQVDGSATRRFGGVGLGLPAVREIIRAHGGELHVDSRLEQGTEFRFTLHRAEAGRE